MLTTSFSLATALNDLWPVYVHASDLYADSTGQCICFKDDFARGADKPKFGKVKQKHLSLSRGLGRSVNNEHPNYQLTVQDASHYRSERDNILR